MLVRGLRGITDYIADEIPLLELKCSMVPLEFDFNVPSVNISSTADGFQGGHYKNVTVELIDFFQFDTQCSGSLCDKAMSKPGKQTCGCVSMRTRRSTQAFGAKLKIIPEDGEEIIIDSFTSQYWFTTYVIGVIPQAYKHNNNDWQLNELINDRIEAVLSEVMRWNAIVWCKWGMVEDEAAKSQAQGM